MRPSGCVEEVQGVPWKPVTTAKAVLASVAFAMIFLLVLRSAKGFIPIIDHANLAFHEAGHLIYGLFGNTLGLYGGTLGQLTFPLVAAISFWMRREAVSSALSGVWFFENWLNIARYMADARAQLLPLVGGGEHDWFHILSRWGLLSRDTTIAGVVNGLGWLGMISMWAWVIWRWWQDRQS